MKEKEKLLMIQSSSLCCIRFERADKESLKCRTKNRQKFAKTESEDKKSLTGFQIPGQEGTVNYKILNTAQHKRLFAKFSSSNRVCKPNRRNENVVNSYMNLKDILECRKELLHLLSYLSLEAGETSDPENLPRPEVRKC